MIAEKCELRKIVAGIKRTFSKEELLELSNSVLDNLYKLDAFNNANTVLLYYSMPDEVSTVSLIASLQGSKRILLPIVDKSGLILKKYTSDDFMEVSKFGIKEPKGELFTDYDSIDVVIVPGVAFDRSMSRMGRGKGYYDGLLPQIDAPKIAICFDFQVFDYVPIDERDIKMDVIVCESEIIKY